LAIRPEAKDRKQWNILVSGELCSGRRAQLTMLRTFVTVASLCALAHAQAPQSPNPVVQWNRNLLALVRTAGAQPATIHPTRSFAMMHAAIYDAVNSIDQSHHAYMVKVAGASRHASQDAAAASAAHDVLVALYPKFQAALESELQTSLAAIPDAVRKADGVKIGATVAAQMLALRGNDGSAATPPAFIFDAAPGSYQKTPPNFPNPVFTHWAFVIPFALQQASQFRPGPPPALTSGAYAATLNEVKAFGQAGGTAATADQTLTGRFWNGPIQNYWNEIAQTAAMDFQLTTARSARLFALLNLTFADSVIAFYDAKYTYKLWRPITGIRAADTDGNPATTADPAWLPVVTNTPADPSYPGAHAVIGAAGAEILSAFLDQDRFRFTVTSEVLPGVTRSFTEFSDAANEASLSRVFAGVHYRADLTTGRRLGRHVASYLLERFLTRVERDDDDD
jgi:hypothetical protein